MAGVDIRVIKEWMGHKSIQTTMRYAAVRSNTSAELIDRL
jgi:site-specific recombinase XerD